jgi:hypothetical protein
MLKVDLNIDEREETVITTCITGFKLKEKRRDGLIEELVVEKEELYRVIDETGRRGDEIRLIEPQRMNLEDFFLDIVRKTGSEK